MGVEIADKDKTDDERVIFVIITDGEENASQNTTKEDLKDIISRHEARGDWTFLYLGDRPDRWERESGTAGRGNAVQYSHAEPGKNFDLLDRVVGGFRKTDARQAFHLFSAD